MKLRGIVLLMCLAAFASACNKQSGSTNNGGKPTPSASTTPDAFAATRGTYAKDCQNCHGVEGKGGPVKLDDGTRLRVPSLREGHALRHPNSDYVKQIKQGGDGMPAFKDKLNQTQIDEIINFIRHEFQGGMAPPAEKESKTK